MSPIFNVHFFVESESDEPCTPAVQFDWSMAQEEVMQADASSDPIQSAIARLERQYEEDKLSALEKQRQEYEKQFQQFKSYIQSPATTPSVVDPLMMRSLSAKFAPSAFAPTSATTTTPGTVMSKLERWGQERDESFKRSLSQLRHGIVRTNGLVREANFFAEESGSPTRFSVTLQIPPENLSPNRKVRNERHDLKYNVT